MAHVNDNTSCTHVTQSYTETNEILLQLCSNMSQKSKYDTSMSIDTKTLIQCSI